MTAKLEKLVRVRSRQRAIAAARHAAAERQEIDIRGRMSALHHIVDHLVETPEHELIELESAIGGLQHLSVILRQAQDHVEHEAVQLTHAATLETRAEILRERAKVETRRVRGIAEQRQQDDARPRTSPRRAGGVR